MKENLNYFYFHNINEIKENLKIRVITSKTHKTQL